MKRVALIVVALLASPALAAPRPAAPALRPWAAIATPAPFGSYVIGNPRARVRLIEILSYTCPHCRHFTDESRAALAPSIRNGTLAIELRNQVHDRLDLVAAALARSARPAVFPALHEALFAQQEQWVTRGMTWSESNGTRLAAYPELAQLRALADGAGLSDIAKRAGMTDAEIARVFADGTAVAAALKVSQAIPARATPAFMLNGRLIENVSWATLQPQLRAAGIK